MQLIVDIGISRPRPKMERDIKNRNTDPERRASLAQEVAAPVVRFIGEQDGPAERELMMQLIQCFGGHQNINAAYLAKVSYGNESSTHVALCLRIQSENNRPAICERISGIFAAMFSRHEHLDILFLKTEQESRIAKVCSPFFAAASAD
jgi:hypothetical protein